MLLLEDGRTTGRLELRQTKAWDGTSLYYLQHKKKHVPKTALLVFSDVLNQTEEPVGFAEEQSAAVFTWIPRKLSRTLHCTDWLRDALSFIQEIQLRFQIPIKSMVFLAQGYSKTILSAVIQDYGLQPKAAAHLDIKSESHSVKKIKVLPKIPLMINESIINFLNGLRDMQQRLDVQLPPYDQTGFGQLHFPGRETSPYYRRPCSPLFGELRRARKFGLFSWEFNQYLLNRDPGMGNQTRRRMLNSVRVHNNHQSIGLSHYIDRRLRLRASINFMDLSLHHAHAPLDLVERYQEGNISAYLVGNDETRLLQQQISCMKNGLHQFQFCRANIFEADQIKELPDAMDVICAYGLSEKIPDDQHLLRTLQALRQLLQPNAYLLLSNHPHHPISEEYLPRVCEKDGGVFRSQHEFLNLVQWAGFVQEKIYLDHEGMFSVIVAKNQKRMY